MSLSFSTLCVFQSKSLTLLASSSLVPLSVAYPIRILTRFLSPASIQFRCYRFFLSHFSTLLIQAERFLFAGRRRQSLHFRVACRTSCRREQKECSMSLLRVAFWKIVGRSMTSIARNRFRAISSTSALPHFSKQKSTLT